MFTVGQNVKCVNSSNGARLTTGCVYKVVDSDWRGTAVKNDSGFTTWYAHSRFVLGDSSVRPNNAPVSRVSSFEDRFVSELKEQMEQIIIDFDYTAAWQVENDDTVQALKDFASNLGFAVNFEVSGIQVTVTRT